MLSFLKRINKRIIFASILTIIYIIVQIIKMREVDIKNTNHNNDEFVFIAEEAFFKIPIKNNTDKIEFNSQIYKMNKDHLIKFNDNYLKTQKIRNLIFEGPIDIAFYNDTSSNFMVPNHFILRNKENQDYFMEFENAKGVYNNGIFETEDKFQMNHESFFVSGDNLFTTNDFNDVLITKNSKLIDKKEKKEENMTITSEILNYFKLQNEIIFKENVYLVQKDLEIRSEFLHAFIRADETGKEEVQEAIFKKNVIFIHKKNSKIRSKSSYFFKKENVFIFCDKAEIESDKGFSKADFYIYYVDLKKVVNLQEKNKFFLKKIQNLDKNASKACTIYQEKINKFIIKNEK